MLLLVREFERCRLVGEMVAKHDRRLSTRPAVALLIETSNAFSREVLQGIRDWMREHRHWAVQLSEQGRGNTPPAWLRNWRGDGMIARIETPAIARAVRACGVPVVNVSAAGLAPEFPVVISDSAAIARLAATHLRERGLRHFAYCGDDRFAWSVRHGRNFSSAMAATGGKVIHFPQRKGEAAGSPAERLRLRRWLKALPKPVGIMACYDIRGQQILDACRAAGLHVPDEVAVIGQHNDELLCELCDPPLASVIPNARRAGFEAAALLEAMLQKKGRARPAVVEIPPLGIATRASTDMVAVADPHVSSAVRFLRDHVNEPIGVGDLVRAAGASRTLIERAFRHHFGCAPYEYLLRLRFAHAQRLLLETDLSVAEIAAASGFHSTEHFSAMFRRRAGETATAFRSSKFKV